MTGSLGRRYPLPALLAAIALCFPLTADAQSAAAMSGHSLDTNTAWNAWLGCWEPIDNRTRGAITTAGKPARADSTMVCVLPVPGTVAAEFTTVTNGEIVGRVRVDPSGERRQRTIDECSGWESAAWSADRKRIYLQSELTCPGEIQRRSSGVLAFVPGLQWLDVQGVTIAEQTATRVQRYRAVDPTSALAKQLPAEIVGTLERSKSLAVWTARSAAAKPLDIDDVIDASRRIDAPVTSAWLVEQAQGFSVNGKDLRRLNAANVPVPVIDILVALSYPTNFAINRDQTQHTPTVEEAPPTNVATARGRGAAPLASRTFWIWDPFDLFELGLYGPTGFYGIRDYYGRSAYYYGPYRGYPGYGTSWYRGYAPVVIVPRYVAEEDFVPPARGRVVNGRGYTRKGAGASAPSSGRASRSRTPSAGSTANTNSSPGNGSANSSGGSGSSGGAERKAKPRGG